MIGYLLGIIWGLYFHNIVLFVGFICLVYLGVQYGRKVLKVNRLLFKIYLFLKKQFTFVRVVVLISSFMLSYLIVQNAEKQFEQFYNQGLNRKL